jgi:hypothetical protein
MAAEPKKLTRRALAKALRTLDYDDVLLADGFDDAFIGTVTRCGQPPIAIYDHERCVEQLVSDGLTYEEAVEYMDFNVTGAWVGDGTPGFLVRIEQ